MFFTGPGPVDPPVLLEVNSRVMSIVWQQPVKRNRTITHYRMYWHGRLYFTALGYQFQVEACTSKGCSKSPESQTVWTLPGTPKVSQAQSCFQTLQHLSLHLATPTNPSDFTENFTIERRVKGKEEIRSLSPLSRSQAMKFVDNYPALSPWTQYEYRVLRSSLNGGTRSSDWVEVTNISSRPAGVQLPRVHCWDQMQSR